MSDLSLSDIRNKKKLWLPEINESAGIIAAVMRSHEIDARPLPAVADKSLALSRRRIPGDVCLPMLYTTESMLERVVSPDFNPDREAFFQGKSSGPCRYGMYFMLAKTALDKTAGKSIDIVTMANRAMGMGVKISFPVMAWDCVVTHDLLQMMLLHTRPFEINPGDSDKIFLEHIARLENEIENPGNKPDNFLNIISGNNLGFLTNILRDAKKKFESTPAKRIRKPVIGIVGEFFVRMNESSNFNLIRTLEKAGCEVILMPETEFFGFSNCISKILFTDQLKDAVNFKQIKEAALRRCINIIAMRHRSMMASVVKSYIDDLADSEPQKIIRTGSEFISPYTEGEAFLSLGKSGNFVKQGVDGIIAVSPFNCMQGIIISALSKEFRKKYGNIPFLNINFDGFEDYNREQSVSTFLSLVKEKFRHKYSKRLF